MYPIELVYLTRLRYLMGLLCLTELAKLAKFIRTWIISFISILIKRLICKSLYQTYEKLWHFKKIMAALVTSISRAILEEIVIDMSIKVILKWVILKHILCFWYLLVMLT